MALTVAVLYQVVDLREKSSNGLMFVSTASGALVVGGVRDIVVLSGDRFECSME